MNAIVYKLVYLRLELAEIIIAAQSIKSASILVCAKTVSIDLIILILVNNK